MNNFKLNLIPGDGIGIEVIAEGKRILKQIEEIHSVINFQFVEQDWGCEPGLLKS